MSLSAMTATRKIEATNRIEANLQALGAEVLKQLELGHQVIIKRDVGTVYQLHVSREHVDAAAVIALEGRAIVSPEDITSLAATLAPRIKATLDLASSLLLNAETFIEPAAAE